MGAVAFLYDAKLHEKANNDGKNYWGVYTAELLDWLGVPAARVSPHDLEDAEKLAGASALVLSRDAAASLEGVKVDFEAWVRSGGLLIGFMPEGMEKLFGVEKRGLMQQGTDPFSVNTTFGWVPSPLTRGIPSPLFPPEPLLILSDRVLLRPVKTDRARTLAASSEGPAIIYRRLGKGATLYFAFDLAQTAWAVHQGRPVDKDYDLDGTHLRTTDGIVTGMRMTKALVVDEVLLVLERVLARHGVVSLDRLPPSGGKPSDALLFWGGDDEGLSDGSQLFASEFMKSKGLPYHINVMPTGGTRFGLSLEDARRILKNGHELSVHFDFVTEWPKPDYTPEDLKAQWKLFVERYRVRPEVYVAHWLRWCGWDETPLTLQRLGMTGENNRLGVPTALNVANPTDRIGFAWGTVFPFHYWAGHGSGNRRIDFVSLPIHCYEMGYDSCTDASEFTHLRAQLAFALHYRLTTGMFYHPCNVARYESCRKALEETLSYMRHAKANVHHMGHDALARWWMARSAASVEDLREGGSGIVRVASECEGGMTLRIPRPARGRSLGVRVDGRTRRPVPGKGIAEGFLMVPLACGEHEVSVTER